jgi:hypothetical protein
MKVYFDILKGHGSRGRFNFSTALGSSRPPSIVKAYERIQISFDKVHCNCLLECKLEQRDDKSSSEANNNKPAKVLIYMTNYPFFDKMRQFHLETHSLLKGPKHEIFEIEFFTQIRPVRIGDLGTGEKN